MILSFVLSAFYLSGCETSKTTKGAGIGAAAGAAVGAIIGHQSDHRTDRSGNRRCRGRRSRRHHRETS